MVGRLQSAYCCGYTVYRKRVEALRMGVTAADMKGLKIVDESVQLMRCATVTSFACRQRRTLRLKCSNQERMHGMYSTVAVFSREDGMSAAR